MSNEIEKYKPEYIPGGLGNIYVNGVLKEITQFRPEENGCTITLSPIKIENPITEDVEFEEVKPLLIEDKK